MTDTEKWERWFAYFPVRVDAYSIKDIKNGKMNYLKVGWVERRFSTDVFDEETGERKNRWLYRPIQNA